MREWLTVIIILLIITVILDGLRRMRANRQSSLKMSLSMHQGTTKDDLDHYGSELPNGGARVVDVRDEHDAEGFNKALRAQKANKQKIKKPYRIPQQVSLNLDEHVPMLMESVDEVSSPRTAQTASAEKTSQASDKQSNQNQQKTVSTPISSTVAPKQKENKPKSDTYDDLAFFDDGDRVEPVLSFDSENNDLDVVIADPGLSENTGRVDRNERDEIIDGNSNRGADKDLEDELEDVLMTNSNYDSSLESRPVEDEIDLIREELRQEREQEAGVVKKTAAASVFDGDTVTQDFEEPFSQADRAELESEQFEQDSVEEDNFDHEEDQNYSEPEDVLVINVMAAKGEYFKGEDLLNIVLSQGMRFGTMNIFHHHEDTENDGCILYSMANLVKPGTFDLNTMDEFTTPGVSLFMPLPLESDSLAAFEKMVATARAIAIQLYGDLKDENRSVFTKQTIEHYRSRIQEFERKYRLKSPA